MVFCASCGCPAGAGAKCKHIAAVIWYINNEDGTSKTSLPQEWGTPTNSAQNKYKKGKRIEDLFPRKKLKANTIVTTPICHSTLVDSYDIFDIPCSFSNMLKVTSLSEVERECKLCLNDILDSLENQFLISSYKKHFSLILFYQKYNDINLFLASMFPLKMNEHIFYNRYIKVNQNACFNIFIETLNQSDSDLWFENRKNRISASTKAHKIRVCRNLTSVGQLHLVNTFLKETNLGKKGSINVTYGKNTEGVAIDAYKQMFDKEVIKSGLVICQFIPWLCASPDGLVLKNGKIDAVLEIKCPISCQSKPIVENGIPNLKYLLVENGILKLKKSSMYFTQCQILMYCTGLLTCEFFIYNNIEPVALTIQRDELFLTNTVKKIETFFFNYYLPELASRQLL